MLTILMTLVGLVVFVFSLFTVGFKSGFKRLLLFAGTGVLMDLLMYGTLFGIVAFIA